MTPKRNNLHIIKLWPNVRLRPIVRNADSAILWLIEQNVSSERQIFQILLSSWKCGVFLWTFLKKPKNFLTFFVYLWAYEWLYRCVVSTYYCFFFSFQIMFVEFFFGLMIFKGIYYKESLNGNYNYSYKWKLLWHYDLTTLDGSK